MMRIAIFALGVVSFAATAEPITLKGLAPGMTKEQLENAAPQFTVNCREAKGEAGVETCGYYPKQRGPSIPALDTLAGAPVQGWVAIVRNGIANTISVRLASSEFSRVSTALREKWGKPAGEESSTIQNRMAAKFDQTELTWRVDGAILVVKQRSSNVDTMGIFLSTEKMVADFGHDRREVKPKQDAKDL